MIGVVVPPPGRTLGKRPYTGKHEAGKVNHITGESAHLSDHKIALICGSVTTGRATRSTVPEVIGDVLIAVDDSIGAQFQRQKLGIVWADYALPPAALAERVHLRTLVETGSYDVQDWVAEIRRVQAVLVMVDYLPIYRTTEQFTLWLRVARDANIAVLWFGELYR